MQIKKGGATRTIILHDDNDGLDRYYQRVKPSLQHTANLGYAFGRESGWHGNVSVRVGVTNVLDTAPPLYDDTRAGYTATISPRGRTYIFQLSKRL